MKAPSPQIRVVLLFIAIQGTTRLLAQSYAIPSPLTLKEAIRLAIARNPSIAAARNGFEAFEGDAVAARKRPNPAVTFQDEAFPIRANPGRFFGTQEITLRFDYEVKRGGRRL